MRLLRFNGSVKYLIMVVLISAGTLWAQSQTATQIKSDFNHFFDVGKALFSAPAYWSKDDVLTLGVTTSIALLLSPVDDEVRTFVAQNHSSMADRIFSIDRFYGHKYSFSLPAAIYLYGLAFGHEQVRSVGLNAMEAFLYAGMVTQAMKILIGRRRPENGDSQYFFKPFQWNNDQYQSFPSGHSTLSFAISTVMAKSVDNIYWKTFWYVGSLMVCAARVYHDRHWVSDVFFGAVVGYSVASFVVDWKRGSEEKRPGFSLQSRVPGGLMFAVVLPF